ncbi:MAG: Mrp/NBP35 family ATP-binding protein [Clostridia bacterium]|nr:Mrp/NBP35 family ATP-binding protein [Clostridia bacterium]
MGCTHDCNSCSSSCSGKGTPESLMEKPHELSSVKKIIGVVSGKGGVGKSMVTSLLAATMQRRSSSTAILDADITGPSIPKAFGIKEKAESDGTALYPQKSKMGTQIMSINLLLEDEQAPVVWRGPIIAGTVKQFWTDVIWNDVDYMFVDMPPGTGDVPLTVFQSLPVDGIIVVTSPQDLVSMIVAKAVNMAKMMNIPILGIIENYSYLKCPDCGKEIAVFGESHVEEIATKHGLPLLARLPIDPALASLCDKGMIELFEGDYMEYVADILEKM